MKKGSAIGIVETSSIAKGFEIADAVLKAAADMGGERTLTPNEQRKQKEMSFTRKDTGVANAAFTGDPEEKV